MRRHVLVFASILVITLGINTILMTLMVVAPSDVVRTEMRKTDECSQRFSMVWPIETELCPSLKCRTNERIPSTWCECSRCALQTDLISMTRGHEEIVDVRHRPEADELPVFQKGALQLQNNNCSLPSQLPAGLALEMRSLVSSLSSSSASSETCTSTLGLALLVTRYEYANLWHTWTDWVNLFTVMLNEMLFITNQPVFVIWLDGHAKSHLDQAWPLVFPGVNFVWLSQLVPERMPRDMKWASAYPRSRLCFKRLILVPQGWMSAPQIAAEKGGPGHCRADIVTLFSDWVKDVTGLRKIRPNPRKVTFLLRQAYLSHPRVDLSRTQRVVTNEPALVEMLHALKKTHDIDADVFYAHNVSVLDQWRRMRETGGLLIGLHGAGLTNLFVSEARVLELRGGEFSARPHFELLCEWLGRNYTKWNSGGGNEVVDVARIRQFIIDSIH